jgi:hypothetical protein
MRFRNPLRVITGLVPVIPIREAPRFWIGMAETIPAMT